ncbi:MAG: alpha/beta hydrolase [Betaproteobacteria bacterium]|nr:alpha/beta hydrolase [Betaproteobacteria bacterium]
MKVLLGFFTAVAIFHGLTSDICAQETISLIRDDRKATSVQAYKPKMTFCSGIAIVSPGAGGSEQGYRYLGEALSSFGYLTVVTGHQESGLRVLREQTFRNGVRRGLAELITDPDAYRGRFMDIRAATGWAQGQCGSNKSVLIGHSMGAATAMIAAGARNHLGANGMNSFSAYIALSPQGAGLIFPENAWSDIKAPMLMITGTRDTELGGGSWETRTEAFKNMPAGCKWLGVIDGATHLNFAGIGRSRSVEASTAQTIGAFLDGVHRGDCRLEERIDGIEIDTK